MCVRRPNSARPSAQGHQYPLSEVKELTPRRVKDKDRVLLLHCQSGARSASAKKILTAMGYTHAFNLGSYERAARIVGTR